MKDFREKLEIGSEFSYSMPSMEDMRKFKSIECGEYKLSIQASYYHYCEPRHTLKNLSSYRSMEIAIFKNDEWVQPRQDEKLKQFPRYEELIDRYEPGEIAVGSCVPVDLIQDLFEYLEG